MPLQVCYRYKNSTVMQILEERAEMLPYVTSVNPRAPGVRFPDRDVVASDDVQQQPDVSVRKVLSRHFLPLFSPRLQRTLGLGQPEQVQA